MTWKTGSTEVELEGLQPKSARLKRASDRYFEANKSYAGLGRASLKSGMVFVAVRLLNVVVQLGSTILLARMLDPHDFGLVAIVFALVAFAPLLIDLGTTDAATQKEHITRGDISTLFWINMAIGSVLALLFAGSSGFVATLFSEPALASILLVSSLTLILAAVPIQHYALMRRAMEFERLALIEISANVLSSIVAVAMAVMGFGYWALVAKPILQAALIIIGAWFACRWLPGWPRITQEVKELVGFGIGVAGYAVTDHISRSADRVALGYFYGAGPLGYFQNAVLIYSNVLNILTDSLHNIAISALTKLKDDMDKLRQSWATALSLASFVSTFAFAVLAVTSHDFVVILLGEKWAPTGPLLCIFAIRGVAQSVERTMGWLHVVSARSDRWMRWGFFSAACQLTALLAGLPFGHIGVATAYAVVMFVLCVPALVYAGRPVGIGIKDVLAAAGPSTTAGLVTIVVGLLVQQTVLTEWTHPARFIVCVPVCMATYLAVVVGVFRETQPLRLALSVLREVGPNRSKGSS